MFCNHSVHFGARAAIKINLKPTIKACATCCKDPLSYVVISSVVNQTIGIVSRYRLLVITRVSISSAVQSRFVNVGEWMFYYNVGIYVFTIGNYVK